MDHEDTIFSLSLESVIQNAAKTSIRFLIFIWLVRKYTEQKAAVVSVSG